MKEKLLHTARTILSQARAYLAKINVAVKHPVGTAVIAGVAGSMATYTLEKTHRERELFEAKNELKTAKEKVDAQREKLDAIINRDQVLLIALREADTYGNRITADLGECRRHLGLSQFALLNSWCLFRSRVPAITTKPVTQSELTSPTNAQGPL